MKCPICGKEIPAGKICACGYDLTQSCLNYRTLCPVPQEQRRLNPNETVLIKRSTDYIGSARELLEKLNRQIANSECKASPQQLMQLSFYNDRLAKLQMRLSDFGKQFSDRKKLNRYAMRQTICIDEAFIAAVETDGRVTCTGGAYYHSYRDNSNGKKYFRSLENIVEICIFRIDDLHRVPVLAALSADGTVKLIYSREYDGDEYDRAKYKSIMDEVSGWKDIVTVSAAQCHIIGLRSDGTLKAAGYNYGGRSNISEWKDIVAVSAGGTHTVGLRSDGTVVASGEDGYGQCDVSKWKDIIAVSAGYSHTVGLRADGTVTVTTDTKRILELDVSGWKNITAVFTGKDSCSDRYVIGLRPDGTITFIHGYHGTMSELSLWTDIALPTSPELKI